MGLINSLDVFWDWLLTAIPTVLPYASFLSVLLGILFALWRLNQQAKASRGQFLVELMRDYQGHDIARANLRPEGKWSPEKGAVPSTVDEWTQLEAYMAFFEQCGTLIDDGMLSLRTFKKLFKGPFGNLVHHSEALKFKLHPHEVQYWSMFIKLARRMGFRDEIRKLLLAGEQIDLESASPPVVMKSTREMLRAQLKESIDPADQDRHEETIAAYATAISLLEISMWKIKNKPCGIADQIESVVAVSELLELSNSENLNATASELKLASGSDRGDDWAADEQLETYKRTLSKGLPTKRALRRSWIRHFSDHRATVFGLIMIERRDRNANEKYRELIDWSLETEFAAVLEPFFENAISTQPVTRIPSWIFDGAREYFGPSFDEWFQTVSPNAFSSILRTEKELEMRERALQSLIHLTHDIERLVRHENADPKYLVLIADALGRAASGSIAPNTPPLIDTEELVDAANLARKARKAL